MVKIQQKKILLDSKDNLFSIKSPKKDKNSLMLIILLHIWLYEDLLVLRPALNNERFTIQYYLPNSAIIVQPDHLFIQSTYRRKYPIYHLGGVKSLVGQMHNPLQIQPEKLFITSGAKQGNLHEMV